MALQQFEGDVRISGGLVVGTSFTPPAGSITAAAIVAAAGIESTKLEHRHHITYRQKTGADVASQTEDCYTAKAAGSVIGVDVFINTAPTGGDKAFTVDVKKSTAGGAFATILSAVETISSADANRSVSSPALAGGATLIDGDTLQVVIATSGTTGSQGQGLVCTLNINEAA